MANSPVCIRCGAPAHMWSGAWLVTASKLWIGWCSNVCKNAWLDGDKEVQRPSEVVNRHDRTSENDA